MAKPTYQDASLIVQMIQSGALSGMDAARNWLWSGEYVPEYSAFVKKYPPGSEGYGNAMKVCGWLETLGAFYKHGLISADLLFDCLAVDLLWERLKGFALGVRAEARDSRLFENFEAMAKAQKA